MARILTAAVAECRNILVAGGTGSGKTTLANALLAEVAGLDQRVVISSRIPAELRCDAKDAGATSDQSRRRNACRSRALNPSAASRPIVSVRSGAGKPSTC